MIELKQLRQLIKLMVDHELTEMDLRDGEEHVKLKRGRGDAPELVTHAPQPVAPPPVAATPATPPPASPEPTTAPPAGMLVRRPMVGTFYSSPNPDAKPFVSVGDRVESSTVVCIIEAMKVFNEIKAEATGVVAEILVESGQTVEFDQPLLRLEP